MKDLHELAEEYANKYFPISKVSTFNTIKHDIAYNSFCNGFNEAIKILAQIDGKRICPFNCMDME